MTSMRDKASTIFAVVMVLLQCLASTSAWPRKSQISSSTFIPVDPTSPAEMTVIDALSADPQFTDLVRILQRLKLVPAINKLEDLTIYAPTNDAIRSSKGAHSLADNLNERSREIIFYHILNYTASHDNSDSHFPQLHQTLLHPANVLGEPTYNPPPHSPWLPEPGDGKSLMGAGQHVRIGKSNDSQVCFGLRDVAVGGNYTGNCNDNGAATILSSKPKRVRNGVIYPIDTVIIPPADLATQIRSHPSLSMLADLMPSQAISNLEHDNAKGLTLFLPTNDAFKALDDAVYGYLHNQLYANPDLLSLMSGHIGRGDGVGWSTAWDSDKYFKTDLKTELQVDDFEVKLDDDTTSKINTIDILASNGVIHLIDSFVTPPRLLLLDSEKALVGLNATRFVDLFRSAHLSDKYLKDDQDNATLLVFRNDVFDGMREGSVDALSQHSDMANTLQYHIIPGNIRKDDVESGELIATELKTHMLDGHGQRVVVTKSERKDKPESTNKAGRGGGWSFNHASVLANEFNVGNKSIYFISSVLEPPKDIMSVAVSDLRLSTFVASVYAAEMGEYLKHVPATTLLIPTNNAFEELGYAMKYLLKGRAKSELTKLINYHVINDIVYLSDMTNGTYKTLLDTDIDLHIRDKGNATEKTVGSLRNEVGYSLNGEERKAVIKEGDILTSSGVIHIIDQVERPAEVDITLRKLLKGSNANTMLDLFQKSGLHWLLDGDIPPPEDYNNPYEKRNTSIGHPVKPYTVLTPNDDAFTHINLTHYYDDRAALEALVRMHILPAPPDYLEDRDPYSLVEQDNVPPTNGGHPLFICDDMAYPSLLSYTEGGPSKYGDVAFKKTENDWTVGIKGARDVNGPEDFAIVLGFGRASPHFYNSSMSALDSNSNNKDSDQDDPHSMSIGGGIVVLDRVLIPYEPSWIYRWGWIVFTALAGTGLLGGGGYASFIAYQRRKAYRAGYESLEGEED
ncbi:hypothetical protein E3P92_01095 [Wallemia ichthyophaga]|nr:hypothetical protein E3P91_00802 [Wallemia ichthyophaga]TIA83100.1 hypothetical protein E3P98_00948 [Wallemia ichthyophaga]TIB17119.1 hypothetical protein E3P92_01095 [Wallemia ichthyophaga]